MSITATEGKRRCPSIVQLDAKLELQAAEGSTDSPRFSLVANTGEPMTLTGFFDPVIIDLQGAEFAKPVTPVIADHDTRLRIGHTTRQEVNSKGVFAQGIVSSSMAIAEGFVTDAKAGFPFETSVGAKIVEGTFVPKGDKVKVNGKEWQGPLIVARKSLIRELSVTVLGADSKTQAVVAASQSQSHEMELGTMSGTTDIKAAIDNERQRIKQIEAMLQPPNDNGWQHVQTEVSAIRAEAIDGQLPLSQLPQRVRDLSELEQIRSSRPKAHGPGIHIHNGMPDRNVLEAAIAKHVNIDIGKSYGEQTAEAADRLGITCIMDAFKIAAQMGGFAGDLRNKDSIIKAAFSSADIATILSNVAGKQSEEAYRAFPSIVRRIARKLTAGDFKQKTGLRVTGDTTFLQVAGTGEIKHASFGEQSFTYAVDTYARMFGLDRKTIINDDLQALDDLPRMLGRGAAIAIERKFWKLVLNNANNFFHADNRNLLTGAGSALDGDSLGDGVQKFLEQTDTEGNPIGVVPNFLVVPPALKVVADELYTSRQWNVGGGDSTDSTRVATANAFWGLYEPLVSPWLGANGGLDVNNPVEFDGPVSGSDTAWYLFGSPTDVAAFGIAFLDGNEGPTIEQDPQQFNLLGVQWRGYIDFGVCQIDHRGGVKSDGA